MKKTMTAMLALILLLTPTALTGCKTRVANNDQTLEIFVGDFGYGYEWLEEAVELFKAEDWVQEKYPELNIPALKHNSEAQYVGETIVSGPSNSIDLFFGTQPQGGYYNRTDASGNSYFEDLSSLYTEMEIPGEGTTIAAKMKSDILAIQDVETTDGTMTYYGLPWVDGTMGLLYNRTLLQRYLGADYILPRTTEELEELAGLLKLTIDINGAAAVPFISSASADYWKQMCIVWWAQYEGLARYEGYWLCTNEYGVMDGSTVAQTGRLRALEALQSLIWRDKGYNHNEVDTMSFTMAQSKFRLGEALIMPNGDWFDNEMRSSGASEYEITFMKMPVISSIVEKCTSVKDDTALSFVVGCADDGMSYEQAKAAYAEHASEFAEASRGELTEADYNRIVEARRVQFKVEGHEAYIPSYATAKELAKDFLLFLATDKAIHSFMEVTNGCGTPYQYDLEEKDPDLYDEISLMQKDRIAIAENALRLPPNNAYKSFYYGGLNWFTRTTNIEVCMVSENPNDRKTAQQIYQQDIDYWSQDDWANWKSMLTLAGMR